jgi:hypothetical protein
MGDGFARRFLVGGLEHGKHTKNDGKSPFYSWVNQLFPTGPFYWENSWLVVTGTMEWIMTFPFRKGNFSSSQLTNSMIFQTGGAQPLTRFGDFTINEDKEKESLPMSCRSPGKTRNMFP